MSRCRWPDSQSSRPPSVGGFPVGVAAGDALKDLRGRRDLGLGRLQDRVHALWRPGRERLAEVADRCPRGCTHAADAPDCELDAWVAGAPDEPTREARAARVDSFRRLLVSRSGAPEPEEQAAR